MSSRDKFEQAIKARFGDLIDYRTCKNSDGEYMAWDMQVAWWAWQAAETDMAVQLANAESKCRELAAGHWPRLQEQDINALMRFNETCEDGEGYDIGAEAMARLVEIGLAGKGPHGIRNITPFGQWVINAREGEVDLEPLKTEEDNIAESALRMAQLRTGAAQ
nr:hypothetical protein [Citrobacter freundii]